MDLEAEEIETLTFSEKRVLTVLILGKLLSI